MPRRRNQENEHLPYRWRRIHGAYYYRVPVGQESFWDFKQQYRLGSTFAEATAAFERRMDNLSARISPDDKLMNIEDIERYRQKDSGAFIYFLWDGPDLVYIGKSASPPARIRSHRLDKQFSHYAVISVDPEDADRLEALYIARHKPRYNLDFLNAK
ncbi:MAG: hypothetical protein V2I66_08165 [Halieaceae bacterium]|jgi:hypothetical protein|nr:hypothetical protein [Halieaceae bacterium]